MNSTINDVPAPVLNADLALLLCAEVWGFPESSPGQATPWQRLQPEWCRRLVTAAERSEGPGREKALAFLRQSHRLQSKAEPDRVHPSWWIRALKDESPAVRRLIATHGPVPVCTAARAAFGFRKRISRPLNPQIPRRSSGYRPSGPSGWSAGNRLKGMSLR